MLIPVRYMLIGNYGVGNAGDEILKQYFLQRFPEIHWEVCSAHPKEDEWHRFPSGIRSFFSFRWIRTLKKLRQCDGVVYGGGSLFTDCESPKACFVWWGQAVFSILLRKRVMLAFQGVGPFRMAIGESLARWVVARSSHISVRDRQSMERLSQWKLLKENKGIVQSSDPSVLLMEAKKSGIRTKNVFILIPRFSTRWTDESIWQFVQEFSHLKVNYSDVRILSLMPGDHLERRLCEKLSDALNGSIAFVSDLMEMPEHIADGKLVVSERYHGLIASMAAGVPCIGVKIEDGDKIDALARSFGCPSLMHHELIHGAITTACESAFYANIQSAYAENKYLAQIGEDALRRALTSITL